MYPRRSPTGLFLAKEPLEAFQDKGVSMDKKRAWTGQGWIQTLSSATDFLQDLGHVLVFLSVPSLEAWAWLLVLGPSEHLGTTCLPVTAVSGSTCLPGFYLQH